MSRACLLLVLVARLAHADPYVDASPACDPERTYCIAITLHVGHAGDVALADPAFVAAQVAMANTQFAPVSVGFHVVTSDAASVPSVDTTKARRALGKTVPGDGTIHLFLTGTLADVDQPGEVIRGVTLRARIGKFVILSNIAPERVLAHELGHVFGLPHSTYAISIMNKAKRDHPPIEQRTFAPQEVAAMATTAAQLVRRKVLAPR